MNRNQNIWEIEGYETLLQLRATVHVTNVRALRERVRRRKGVGLGAINSK